MKSPDTSAAPPGRWTSLWVIALLSLVLQLAICQFFSFGEKVPISTDVNPSNLWKFGYHFPPTGTFQVLNWLGIPYSAYPLNPLSIAVANESAWLFFTSYTPIICTLSLLAMAAFLRELELSRPAALFGGVIFAWQGDLLTFVFPGHYGYITSWPFYAIAAWGALRAERTGHWAYPVISGASCGIMVGLLTNADRGAIASLLIAALYLALIFRRSMASRTLLDYLFGLRHLLLCVAVAFLIALAPLLALFQSNIIGVKIAGTSNRAETYKLVTQYSYGPAETLTYLVPGFFGWHVNHPDGPYWGWVGEWPDWPKKHEGMRNFNLAISTTGTVAAVLALIAAGLLFPGRWFGSDRLTERQRYYGRVLLGLGFVALILAWGRHTPLYWPLFELPLMDKWRNPLKWLEWTNFALVVLSAYGMQHLVASLETDAPDLQIIRQRLVRFTNVTMLLLGAGLLVSYPLSLVLADRLHADSYDPYAIANIISTIHASLLWALVLMVLFSLLLRVVWYPARLRTWRIVNPLLQRLWQRILQPEHLPLTLTLGTAFLAVVQLSWVAGQFIAPVQLESLTMSNPLLEALRTEGNTVRVSVAPQDPLLNDLLQNQFSALKISCLDISAASRIPDDINTFFKTLDPDQARLWFLAGVKDVVIPQQGLQQMRLDPGVAANIERADGYTLEQTSSPDLPSHALVVMKDYLAKATLVPHAEFFAKDDALLKRLGDLDWNPRDSILLEKGKNTPPPANVQGSSTDSVDLKTYEPTEIEIQAQSARGGYLLINDQYDPDWQVQVNGHDAELLRADYILRAIQIPPGASTVTLHYVEHYRVAGLNLPAVAVNLFSDGIMLAAWLLAAIALWRRRNHENADPTAMTQLL
jgi:hypothetical protein